MDCNKEEATRALALAEDKMRSGDFTAARKLVLKAQSLFSGLESVPKMLAVCDVHSSAEEKINGLENWYGILQVMHFANDATIKKQYRKLALLLHPDKNQFPGAEPAFQFIMEASTLLSDKEKRSQYDIKRRIYSREATTRLNANSNPQSAAANNASGSIINNHTFWTRCEHCGYRYKYMAEYMNTLLYCSNCQRSFIAYNTGFDGARPRNAAAEVDKRKTVKEKLNQKNGEAENMNDEVRKPKTEDRSWKKNAQLNKSEKGERKMKNNAELPKADVSNPQPEVTQPETGALNSVPDASRSKKNQAPSMSKGKNKRRKFVEEPAKSINNEHKADSKDNNRRRSPRKRQQDSCAKEGSSNDYISPPTKKSKPSVQSSKRPDSGGSSYLSRVNKGKAKKNVDSRYQETSASKGRESKGCEENGEAVVMAGKVGNNHKANEKPITQDSPDPDFNNFELTTSCFAANQVWALYDSTDGMPRFYARIKEVLDSEFKLLITWIDPVHDGNDNSIPIACGNFEDGDSEEVDDLLMFSSQMLHLHSVNNIVIYPRKGEIWAVFKGWNISWRASSINHIRPYEYDFVEVLSDFKDEDGIGVAYLAKVEGFVSLFRRDAQHGVFQLQVPPSEMLRFSHKAPSFKMTGKEREGIPPGCFELDTLALPKDMFEVDVKSDREKLNWKTGDPFPEASEVEVQAKTSIETSTSPKKRDNKGSYSKASDGKFRIDEIWAIYNNAKGMPRKYGQIKKIDTSPELQVHVAPLELYGPPKVMTHPVCCGCFKLKIGKAEVLAPSSFSHKVKAVKTKINRFEIYPGKGEVWALYRKWNSRDCVESEEVEFVEVVGSDEQSIQVAPLIGKGLNKRMYKRSEESKAGFVEIPKTEVSRFSHQIPAVRQERRATRYGDGECWELDPKAAGL